MRDNDDITTVEFDLDELVKYHITVDIDVDHDHTPRGGIDINFGDGPSDDIKHHDIDDCSDPIVAKLLGALITHLRADRDRGGDTGSAGDEVMS